jgi:uncharacterized metal-binding protein YceD (DUF177 family)
VTENFGLSVGKFAMQKFDVESFNLKKLNNVKDKEQYQVKISNRFAVLANLIMWTSTRLEIY